NKHMATNSGAGTNCLEFTPVLAQWRIRGRAFAVNHCNEIRCNPLDFLQRCSTPTRNHCAATQRQEYNLVLFAKPSQELLERLDFSNTLDQDDAIETQFLITCESK